MKRVLICGIIVSLAIAGCNKGDNDLISETENIELRAATLGFADVNMYQAYVRQQCAAGNHENCCILENGTHQACVCPNHAGINCDGTYLDGNNHAGQGSNGQNPDCTNFADADGDGKCDNCTNACTGIGSGPQDGSGNQHRGRH